MIFYFTLTRRQTGKRFFQSKTSVGRVCWKANTFFFIYYFHSTFLLNIIIFVSFSFPFCHFLFKSFFIVFIMFFIILLVLMSFLGSLCCSLNSIGLTSRSCFKLLSLQIHSLSFLSTITLHFLFLYIFLISYSFFFIYYFFYALYLKLFSGQQTPHTILFSFCRCSQTR